MSLVTVHSRGLILFADSNFAPIDESPVVLLYCVVDGNDIPNTECSNASWKSSSLLCIVSRSNTIGAVLALFCAA